MATTVVLSAKGSPGATTTALLLAALWPAEVLLVDADPAGGDVALRLPAADGRPLDPDRGLLPLLTAARRGLAAHQLLEQAQEGAGGTRVVAGLAGPGQAAAAVDGWRALAGAVTSLGAGDAPGPDVVVDAGRVTTDPVHLPLLRAADAVVLVVRADVPGVVHARERVRSLLPLLRRADGSAPRTGVVAVGDPRGRDVAQVAGAVAAGAVDADDVEDLGRLPLDGDGARVFSGAGPARPERTALVRAGRDVTDRVHAAAHGGPRAARRGAA